MLAPPKPPTPDALEALIKEARERQLRRRLLAAAAVATVAGLGLGIYALVGGFGQTRGASGSTGGAPPPCRSSQLSVSAPAGPIGAGPMGVQMQLVDRSGSACALPAGLPSVTFTLDGKTVPTKQRLMPPPYTDFGSQAGRVLAPGRKVYYLVEFGECANPADDPTSGTATVAVRFGQGLRLSAPESTPEHNGIPIVPACSGRNIAVSPLLRYR